MLLVASAAGASDLVFAASFDERHATFERHVYVYGDRENRQYVCRTMLLQYVSWTGYGSLYALGCEYVSSDTALWPPVGLTDPQGLDYELRDDKDRVIASGSACRPAAYADLGAHTSSVIDCRSY